MKNTFPSFLRCSFHYYNLRKRRIFYSLSKQSTNFYLKIIKLGIDLIYFLLYDGTASGAIVCANNADSFINSKV